MLPSNLNFLIKWGGLKTSLVRKTNSKGENHFLPLLFSWRRLPGKVYSAAWYRTLSYGFAIQSLIDTHWGEAYFIANSVWTLKNDRSFCVNTGARLRARISLWMPVCVRVCVRTPVSVRRQKELYGISSSTEWMALFNGANACSRSRTLEESVNAL